MSGEGRQAEAEALEATMLGGFEGPTLLGKKSEKIDLHLKRWPKEDSEDSLQ